jgi:hypothetical protein
MYATVDHILNIRVVTSLVALQLAAYHPYDPAFLTGPSTLPKAVDSSSPHCGGDSELPGSHSEGG